MYKQGEYKESYSESVSQGKTPITQTSFIVRQIYVQRVRERERRSRGKLMSCSPNEMDSPPSSSTLPPHKESYARRFKSAWPFLLTVNFAIGAYLFTRTKKKDKRKKSGEIATEIPSSSVVSTIAPVTEQPLITEPVRKKQPIPIDQQHELLKWILEEKRKIKPKNIEEKNKLDEEKAILKQFIRSESIPTL